MENVGKVFGRLTIIDSVVIGRKRHYKCECSCGNVKIIRKDSILKEKQPTRSCGCIKKEQDTVNLKPQETTHGLTKHRIYAIFNGMKDRCYNNKNARYYRYGGRGIKICQKWLDDFLNFYNWAIFNGYKEGLTIERKNNNGNYSPENCEWIEFKEQSKNRKNTIKIMHENKIYCLMDFSKIVNIPYGTLINRVKNRKLSRENYIDSNKIITRKYRDNQ